VSGLALWAPDPAIRSDTITAVRVPPGIDERTLGAQTDIGAAVEAAVSALKT
jgi:aspartate aminotransferase-like enzyme